MLRSVITSEMNRQSFATSQLKNNFKMLLLPVIYLLLFLNHNLYICDKRNLLGSNDIQANSIANIIYLLCSLCLLCLLCSLCLLCFCFFFCVGCVRCVYCVRTGFCLFVMFVVFGLFVVFAVFFVFIPAQQTKLEFR